MIPVGGLEHEIYFSIMYGNVIIPTGPNSIIFQRGRSTTNQMFLAHNYPASSAAPVVPWSRHFLLTKRTAGQPVRHL